MDNWLRVIDDELVSLNVGVASGNDSLEDARKKLKQIIDTNISIFKEVAGIMIEENQMKQGFSSDFTKKELQGLFSKGFKVRMFSLEDQTGMLCLIDEHGKVYFNDYMDDTDSIENTESEQEPKQEQLDEAEKPDNQS